MIDYENLGKLNQPFFEEYKKAFNSFLKSGWFILGKATSNFEQEFAKYNDSEFCVGVASGLDALILTLDAFGFPKGSQIIVPSNTYIATIIAIVRCGHVPVLVEPNIKTYNIDPDRIEEKITGKTRAIIPVHLYGKVCQMDKIKQIAEKYDLNIIEDSAQAHGAMFKDKKAGTFGTGAFSFYPTKNLGALGDGGAILTNNEKLVEKIKKLRNYGSEKKYYNELVGYNSRLDEIQAAFLSIKLKRLDEINRHKRQLAKIYLENLKGDFIKPIVENNFYDVYHIFNVRHEKRDRLKEYLLKNGIKTEIHYPVPPHKQKAMQDLIKEQCFSISEEIHNTTLSLPISYCHTKEDIYKVIEVMNKF